MTSARASAFILIILLMTYGVYRMQHQLDPALSVDSYGVNGLAYGAAFELLATLGVEVGRNVAPPSALASSATDTIWWLNAHFQVCQEDLAADWAAKSWVDGGGTAVVFLRSEMTDCDAIGGLTLPPVEESPELAKEACEEDDDGGEDAALASDCEDEDDEDLTLSDFQAIVAPPLGSEFPEWITGELSPIPRELSIANTARFEEPTDEGPWRVVARLDGAPFVIEARSGSGRIVVVADDIFVTNRYLDINDASTFVVDLVRYYGDPTFDEFSHGHRPAGGALPYLARSPAWPVFAAIGLIGLLVALRGSAVPKRIVEEADPRAPALEPFVESLSNLYAASSDQAGILVHYREQVVDRARRRAHLPVGTPRSTVLERTCGPELAVSEIERELKTPLDVRGAQGFERESNRLDRLLEKMTR